MIIRDEIFENYIIEVLPDQFCVGIDRGGSIRKKKYFTTLEKAIEHISRAILSDKDRTVDLNNYLRLYRNISTDIRKTVERKRRAKRRK